VADAREHGPYELIFKPAWLNALFSARMGCKDLRLIEAKVHGWTKFKALIVENIDTAGNAVPSRIAIITPTQLASDEGNNRHVR
jgi:hypothetical protein